MEKKRLSCVKLITKNWYRGRLRVITEMEIFANTLTSFSGSREIALARSNVFECLVGAGNKTHVFKILIYNFFFFSQGSRAKQLSSVYVGDSI